MHCRHWPLFPARQRLFFIFLQADTIEQGQSGDGLCLDVAISGGYPVPAHGFPVAFGGSPAVRIAVGQPVLGFRYITPGGLQEPVESLFRVFEGAFAGGRQQFQVLSGKDDTRWALSGQGQIPSGHRFIAIARTDTV